MGKTPRQKIRRFGKGAPQHKCVYCGTNRGLIHLFGITICRRCFRERAFLLGFRKYGR
ncbi:MAG: 30S ribosomal protein S14 [bacterium]|nr:30S ribosomal protein S14 [bacterium]